MRLLPLLSPAVLDSSLLRTWHPAILPSTIVTLWIAVATFGVGKMGTNSAKPWYQTGRTIHLLPALLAD